MRTHVTHGEVSRFMVHETVAELRQKTLSFFGLAQETKLELYDEDWSTWTLLEDGDIITACRPRVRTTPAMVILDASSASILIGSQSSVADSDATQTTPAARPATPPLLPLPSPVEETSPAPVSERKSPSPTISRMDTLRLFDDSQLRPALLSKLHNKEPGDPLTRSEWSEVATVIVNHEKTLNSSLNLTHSRYMELADQALVQWPALLVGCTPKQALSRVKSKVQWRVRNAKRPEPSLHVPVKRAGSEMVPSAKRVSKAPRYQNFEGYPDYLPPAPEEDIQQQRNRLKRGDLDDEERRRLLAETFSDRRHHAVALRTSMKRFLQIYPSMKQQDEIWSELERISGATGGRSRLPEYQKRLGDYVTAVQQTTECDDAERVDSLLEFIGVNSEDIFSESAESVHFVDADCTGSSALVVEGQQVVENIKDMSREDMLLMWAAAHPVFNQRVPKKSSKIALIFVTEHILGRKGAGILPNRALCRVEKLMKLLE